ncbi:MFS transporter [Streptomyces sp. LX-29]|uniref:MFS transporter n=1 Tax=Streptomyces sp. LX-29 TaxID=2900152 RepID=UPI00240D1AFC|nr:MFS transporter [Streptomyces sp. LX-29]WFB07271.1 MFS transporter [Streptomyces sp. LX-29]
MDAPPADPAAPAEGAPARQGPQLLALALGFVMATLDVTIMNVAGAELRDGLGLSLSGLTWVVDGYVLAFASLLLLAGSLAARLGARRVYLVGLGLFTAASLLCAAAPGAWALVVGRLLQGAGAALFMPSSLTLLLASFPDERRRTRVLGLWSAIVSTAAGLGPALGGLLVGGLGWRSIFLINIPVGVVGLLLARRVIAPVAGRPGPLGAAGHALGLLALGALSYGLIEGPEKGWEAVEVLTAFAVALAAGAAFVLRERTAAVRVLPGALFADPRFSAANAIGFLFNLGAYGGMFMLGLFLQNARGADPIEAGLQLLPTQLVFLVGNILYARWGHRVSHRAALVGSLLYAAVGPLALALTVSPETPYWVLAVLLSLFNTGLGIASPAMTGALMTAAGRAHADIASATLNANRQVGSLVGIAVMGAVIAGAGGWYAGATASFALTATAYLAAALLAWWGLRARTTGSGAEGARPVADAG